MTGELFEMKENILKVVSLDGHRIAIRKIELKDNYPSRKVVVPGKTLNEISKILSGEVEDQVKIFFTVVIGRYIQMKKLLVSFFTVTVNV